MQFNLTRFLWSWPCLLVLVALSPDIGAESNVPQLPFPPSLDSVGTEGDNQPTNYNLGSEAINPPSRQWDADIFDSNRSHSKEEVKRYQVASFDFNHVATPYIISLWIIIVGLAKIGFHVTPKLSNICPESVVLMILGVLIGILLFYGGIDKPSSLADSGPSFQQPLTPNIFFLYMLPPIIMDAGYHMPNRLFFDNLSSILLYAVLGTIWNALTIGISLYLCAQSGLFGVEIPLLDTLLFSSIVAAVDPVAVLAVFEEIHVNDVLYILVFGESLLNDAVTVVLYHMFEGYTEMGADNILAIDYIAGFASFFVIALGGVLMGVIWGFAAAFVSRFTHHVKIIEPIFVFVMAYLSYLSAEMFHLSGIMALTFCGITMKNYVEENITQTSQTTLKYAMKMLSNSSESVIFLFLGVCTVTDTHDWNTWFVILTIVFALVFRALGVVLFTSIANRFRLHKLKGIEQFIMAYGGLRGAVAFALVLVVNERIIPTKKMMVTTIIAIVYFTVFLQGMTVGPLVKILKVPRANKFEVSMNERIHMRLMDHVMAGVEDISGMMVGNYKIRDKFRHFNNRYLKHWFLRDSHERGNSSRKIFETYSRLNLQDAINIVNKQYVYNNNPPSKSLSSIFRSFTESNIGTVKCPVPDHLPAFAATGAFTSIPLDTAPASSFNYDMANLNYSPCHRDMADAEIHHILSDNLFKPVKRYRKYSKSDLPEVTDAEHPTLQHQARLQVRHLMSQNLKRRRPRKSKPDLNGSDSDEHLPSRNGHVPSGQSPIHQDIGLTELRRLSKSPMHHHQYHQQQSTDHEDEGIMFTAKAVPPGKSASDTRLDTPRTAVESSLPWRRNSAAVDNGAPSSPDVGSVSREPLKSEEYPPWLANKEYLKNYASPTNTLLRNLDRDRQSDASSRPIFEIFLVNESPGATGGFLVAVDTNSQRPGREGEHFESTVSTDGATATEDNQNDTDLNLDQSRDATAINLGFEDDEGDHVSKL